MRVVDGHHELTWCIIIIDPDTHKIPDHPGAIEIMCTPLYLRTLCGKLSSQSAGNFIALHITTSDPKFQVLDQLVAEWLSDKHFDQHVFDGAGSTNIAAENLLFIMPIQTKDLTLYWYKVTTDQPSGWKFLNLWCQLFSIILSYQWIRF